jgi:hypothetical protein
MFVTAGATLLLMAAALIAGKPLWVILMVWALGGPVIVFTLMLALTLGEVLERAFAGAAPHAGHCNVGERHV